MGDKTSLYHVLLLDKLRIFYIIKMPALPLKAPLKPSGLVKTARWALLLTGVAWGNHRWHIHHATEQAWREKEAIEKPIRDAKAAKDKAALDRIEMITLAGDVGVPVPK